MTGDDEQGRAVLAAYLPEDEPAVPRVTVIVERARARRRRDVAVLTSVVAVVAVLLGGVAVLRHQPVALVTPAGGGQPTGPIVGSPTPSDAPASGASSGPCQQQTGNGDTHAKAWAAWVAGQVSGVHPQPGPASRIRMCELDMGYTVFPPHTMYRAMLSLPLRGGGTETLTAVADRWDRLPAQLRVPCNDDIITVQVSCSQSGQPGGARLIVSDFYDILIYGDPKDPHAKRDKAADRGVTLVYPDGRALSLGLAYDGKPAFRQQFTKHRLTLAQLGAILLDPQAQQFFPPR